MIYFHFLLFVLSLVNWQCSSDFHLPAGVNITLMQRWRAKLSESVLMRIAAYNFCALTGLSCWFHDNTYYVVGWVVERQLPEKVLTFVDTSLSIIDNFNFSNYFWPDSLTVVRWITRYWPISPSTQMTILALTILSTQEKWWTCKS